MRRYIELSKKYLKGRLRRTLYMFLGVAVAVAFITAIFLLFESIDESQKQTLEKVAGAHHGKVESISEEEIVNLSLHKMVDNYGVQMIVAAIEIPDEQANIYLEKADSNTMKLRAKRLIKGKLPEQPGEIVLDLFALDLLDLTQELGQTVRLSVNGQDRQYNLVGISSVTMQEKNMSTAIAFISPVEAEAIANKTGAHKVAYFTVDAPNSELIEATKKVTGDLELSDKSSYNGTLIYYLQNQSPINWPAMVLSIFVAIASAVSIYNTMNISVLERIRQFGLIRAAGATPSQIRHIVFRESIIVSVLSIPAGLLIGILLAYGVISYAGAEISGLEEMTAVLSPVAFIIASALGFVSVVISSFIPAIKASKISPVEAIRYYGEQYEARKSGSLTRKDLINVKKIPLKLAVRNMRRNKGSTVISVISMTIAATLFIVFSYFVGNFDAERITRDVVKSDFYLRSTNMQSVGPDKDTVEEIISIDGVEAVAAAKKITGRMMSEEEAEKSREQSTSSPISDRGYVREVDFSGVYLNLLAYNDSGIEYMKNKVVCGEISLEKVSTEPSLIIDVEYSEIHDLFVGDEIFIKTFHLSEDMVNFSTMKKFTVVAIISDLPTVAYTVSDGIIAMCSEKMIEKLKPSDDNEGYSMRHYSQHYSHIDVYLEDQANAEFIETQIEKIAGGFRNTRFVSYLDYKEETDNTIKTLSTMVYGLIFIVGFIGLCGITNTVNTNLILRQREFGILRAVGMTRSQLKKMLACEGLIFGLVSSVFSVIIGLALSYVLYYLFKAEADFLTWTIPWWGVFLASGGLIVAGILSTLLSSGRIASLNITEALRTSE
ncbi:MAG: FtsX-like permease family protein [Kosmotogaceae bacterium]